MIGVRKYFTIADTVNCPPEKMSFYLGCPSDTLNCEGQYVRG